MSNIFPIIRQLFSCFPHAEGSDGTIAQYVRLLSDIPAETLQIVVDQSIAECRFVPSIAELRERFHALSGEMSIPLAAEEWGRVELAKRREGRSWKPQFKNPLTQKAVLILGWSNLCLSDNPVADRAHFIKIYDQLVERGRRDNALLPHARQMLEQSTIKRLTDAGSQPQSIAAILGIRAKESEHE